MNNKKSYKDFKYTYTGYKDYCKDHSIKVENKPTNNKSINHDHRFKFDFNNPNEHYHDYSFDFNNPSEHYHDYSFDFSENPQPKNQTANSKTNYTNTYTTRSKDNKAKPMATTARSTSTAAKSTTYSNYSKYNDPTSSTYNSRYNTTTNNTYKSGYNTPIITVDNILKNNTKKDSKALKIAKLYLFFFIGLPLIFSLLSTFFESTDSYDDYNDYDYNYEESYPVNENYINIKPDYYTNDQYTFATAGFCNAIKSKNINYMKDRITHEELYYNNGEYWTNKINSYYTEPQAYFTCSETSNYDLSVNQISYLEDDFYNKYDEMIELSEAKRITLKINYIYQNTQTTKYETVVVGRINNKWYFINVKDTNY